MRASGQLFCAALCVAACSTPKFETLDPGDSGAGDASAGTGGGAASGGTAGSSGGVAGNGGSAGSSGSAGNGDASAGASGTGGLVEAGVGGLGGAGGVGGTGAGGWGGAGGCNPVPQSTGLLSPQTVVAFGPGSPWTNPTGAEAQLGGEASASVNAALQTTQLLKATNYQASVPTGAKIAGIRVVLRRHSGKFDSSVKDHTVRLLKATIVNGSNYAKNTPWDNIALAPVYGSSADTWGATWNPASVNAPGFGVAVAAQCNGACTTADEARVDHIQVEVFYLACQ